MTHGGPSGCFDSEQAGAEAVREGKVAPGDVVVLRCEGPLGGPRMPEMSALPGASVGAGLGGNVALVTHGRFAEDQEDFASAASHRKRFSRGLSRLCAIGMSFDVDLEAGRLISRYARRGSRPLRSVPITASALLQRRARQIRALGHLGFQGSALLALIGCYSAC